jgi:hypothetical protein
MTERHPRRCVGAASTETSAITHLFAGLDALLERLAAARIAHEPIETY